ncbi:MAG: uracil-DNA glycosylase family protein [Muribaculaceae bacterium]|nr:uracil-DNA glycosylase family protein [Muribaculaceae bacterium]
MIKTEIDKIKIEQHPFEPFLPDGAVMLMLGTFPPKPERWSMEFYYPNKINDMWRIMGVIFFGDKNHFWIDAEKRFDLSLLKAFLTERKIALYDTATRVRRLKDNASDKFLDIVETIDLDVFFKKSPTLRAIVTAGEKATGVIAEKAGVEVPKTGEVTRCTYNGHVFDLYRMPSSSRAYPLSLEKKADAYRTMFRQLGYEV